MDTYKAREGLNFIVTNSHGQKVKINSESAIMMKNSPLLRRMVKDKDLIKIEGGE